MRVAMLASKMQSDAEPPYVCHAVDFQYAVRHGVPYVPMLPTSPGMWLLEYGYISQYIKVAGTILTIWESRDHAYAPRARKIGILLRSNEESPGYKVTSEHGSYCTAACIPSIIPDNLNTGIYNKLRGLPHTIKSLHKLLNGSSGRKSWCWRHIEN